MITPLEAGDCILGIDTSCYTTSAALVSARGLEWEARTSLSVKPGAKGLRQSEALFQHVKNFPALMQKIPDKIVITAVAASVRPRPQDGSYMPVFVAGTSFGETLAATLRVPFFQTTHQEGHLEAAFQSSPLHEKGLLGHKMLAVHISGGTTELLRATRRNAAWEIDLLGGSTDLSAGQFIDRVGQALDLPFPAGPHLEQLALQSSEGAFEIPAPCEQYQISFSGPTTAALRAIEKGIPSAEVASAVLQCIAFALVKMLRKAVAQEQISTILIVGGVAANRLIRRRLINSLEQPQIGGRVFFGNPGLSGDNAVGVAYIGRTLLGANTGAGTSTGAGADTSADAGTDTDADSDADNNGDKG